MTEHEWCRDGHGWRSDPVCLQVVRGQHLEELIRTNPCRGLSILHGSISRSSNTEEIAGVVELTVSYGNTLKDSQPENALGMFLAAASLAYPHLGIAGDSGATRGAQQRLIQAYNHATAETVMLLQSLPDRMRSNRVVFAGGRSYRLAVRQGDAASDPHIYEQWLPADRWQQSGLYHRYQEDGLGARLIAIHANRQTSALERHQPDEGIYQPSTAILRFPSLKKGSSERAQTASLVLYDPAITSKAEVNGRQMTLAGDYTLPWAMLATHTHDLRRTQWSAMVRPSETPRPHRLYLMEPYVPDRIPIIMVHGLHATPLAWRQMTNELMGDPVIRRHYQIWHYLYPTGLPFLTSAADFRDDIEEVRHLLDPGGHDYASRNMVVIAHSMGGLLTRTLITDSGDALWDSTFSIPVSRMDARLKQVPELRRMFYFHPTPYIKRVIFMSVPHRGSDVAEGFWGHYFAGQVRLSNDLQAFMVTLRASAPDLLKPGTVALFDHGYPNSIQVLAPSTPGLVALAKLPVAPGIPFHSIMGDRGRGDKEQSSDGVVPYSSSHLSGAASEKFVPSDHGTNESPQAIEEVKRILLLHLEEPSPR